MTKDDVYYKAMLARDSRFDGKFFVGVKTTGIYCRPICPAKPKRENVVFYPNHHAAERAGFRPCLRCRPESAPQTPAWIGTSATVQRALRLLQTSDATDFSEDTFSQKLGVTARHLRRLFNEEIGKTPKQIVFDQRLNLARKLIVESALPFAEIAYASGFRSVRRFNDAFKERFKKTPQEIRSNRKTDSSSLTLSLSYRPPFNFKTLLRVYKSHAVGKLEWFTDESMSRVVHLQDETGVITITNDASKSALNVEIDFPKPAAIFEIVARVRALFDLDSDPLLVANAIEADKKLKAILKKHAGIRLASGWDPFEVAIQAILGQLVSVERGRALVNDLIELLGQDSGLFMDGQPIKLFPSAESIAEADLSALKTTRIRKATLTAFADAIVAGEVSLDPTQDVDEFKRRVLAIKGIGPWTANYMALRCLRNPDAFPETDLLLARALELHPKDLITKMRPWRAYVAALLWREYSGVLLKGKT